MKKVLVTPRSLTSASHPALDLLRGAGCQVIFSTPGKQPDEEELIGLLPGCEGYLAGVERVSARVLEAAKGLQVISRNGTGIDNIDMNAANRLNIQVCRAEGANARGVAELTLGLILALVRSIPFSDSQLKNKRWERRKGIELENQTLGLIGCGEIGKRTALLATGMGMKVFAFRRYPDYSFSPPNFSYVSLEDLYRQSDIISLHCPSLESGKALINKEAIAKMKNGAYLVNTARASLLDLAAVLEALESGRLAGAAVDVFDQEPPADYRLVKNSRAIATPHIGGYTSQSIARATTQAVENIINVLHLQRTERKGRT
jgi:phosphoglycerate dehydrogenase-like enzyme